MYFYIFIYLFMLFIDVKVLYLLQVRYIYQMCNQIDLVKIIIPNALIMF